jgi:hypothetical protein
VRNGCCNRSGGAERDDKMPLVKFRIFRSPSVGFEGVQRNDRAREEEGVFRVESLGG